jgi:hypothetical protein
MKYKFTIFIALFFCSCQEVIRPEMPENLIPEDKMVEVLTEVYLINAARSFDNRTIIDNKMKLDSFIYNKYEIDSTQFANSNAYYTANLDTYDRLFIKVEERMLNLKAEVDSLMVIRVRELEAKRIKDSIAGVENDSIRVDSLRLLERDTISRLPKLIEPKSTQLP